MKIKNKILLGVVIIAIFLISGSVLFIDNEISEKIFNPQNTVAKSLNTTMEKEDSIKQVIPLNNTYNISRNYSSHYDKKGNCDYVVDGDTIDVEGVGRIRFVGVNTPERGDNPGYTDAKNFIKELCLGKTIYLDIDDKKEEDRYGRVLAVLYVDGININEALLKMGYAEIMYMPPSEFYPYDWT
ncbi:MAG: thermonuclease family protein [Methanobrevibacter sp.]|jgi:micrococcal nuclease|nr:thermonuclease family protein [Candidatus Methanoflexus mossambicus]